jgi:flagella basal body P-ring formation protein FlgA
MVRVTVRPTAAVSQARVSVGDVADLAGGEDALRRRISILDLADLPPSGETVLLREQIYYRIRIADIDPRCYRVEGASQVGVSWGPHALAEADVLEAAKSLILAHLPGKHDDVSIQLVRPIRIIPAADAGKDETRLEASFTSSAAPVGRVQVDVAIHARGVCRGVVSVLLDVKLYQRVVLTSRRVAQGEPLTPNNVYVDRRALDSLNSYLTVAELQAGRRAKHPLAPGQLLNSTDVESTSQDCPVLVKAQSLVKMVARVGPLAVTALGEALQEGRAGQSIRVRNLDSKIIVIGRVTDHSLVEVGY